MSDQITMIKETLQEFNEKNEAKISEISKQFSEELKVIELENKALKTELEKTKTETFAEIDKAKVEAKKVVSVSQSNESVEYEMKKPICDAVSNIVKGEKISDSEFSKVAKGLEFALSKHRPDFTKTAIQQFANLNVNPVNWKTGGILVMPEYLPIQELNMYKSGNLESLCSKTMVATDTIWTNAVTGNAVVHKRTKINEQVNYDSSMHISGKKNKLGEFYSSFTVDNHFNDLKLFQSFDVVKTMITHIQAEMTDAVNNSILFGAHDNSDTIGAVKGILNYDRDFNFENSKSVSLNKIRGVKTAVANVIQYNDIVKMKAAVDAFMNEENYKLLMHPLTAELLYKEKDTAGRAIITGADYFNPARDTLHGIQIIKSSRMPAPDANGEFVSGSAPILLCDMSKYMLTELFGYRVHTDDMTSAFVSNYVVRKHMGGDIMNTKSFVVLEVL